jgi:oligopeptide/dipeptide ABC transporter ATP-binding protein
MTNNESLVEIRNLKKYFPVGSGLGANKESVVKAVDGVSLSINRGETFGLVGESGCGKTTVGRCILRLIEPTDGEIVFDGVDLLRLNANQLREKRRDMQIIFQDPFSSLNPRMTIGEIVGEPLIIHSMNEASGGNPLRSVARSIGLDSFVRSKQQTERVAELLRVVGLGPDYASRYPHEFSGGQRQRIGIARALALNPKLIIADEPVSALDVSIQAQVVNLLQDLQEQFGLTYLFISHGLAVVEHISTRVGVMYLGKLVEVAPAREIYQNPLHPYTQALLSSIPVPDPDVKHERVHLAGDVPTPINPPSGCRFSTRCPYVMEECRTNEPPLINITNDHQVACFLVKPETVT